MYCALVSLVATGRIKILKTTVLKMYCALVSLVATTKNKLYKQFFTRIKMASVQSGTGIGSLPIRLNSGRGCQVLGKAKMWCLTIHEANFKDFDLCISYLKRSAQLTYLLVCEHNLPHPHFHVFAQYKNNVLCDAKKINFIHVKRFKSYGTPQQYINYCKGLDEKHQKLGVKCKIVIEEGESRKSGGVTIRDVEKMSQDERKDLPFQYFNIVKNINRCETNDIDIDDWDKEVKIIWIWGMSGTGKSTAAKQYVRTHPEYGRKINVLSYMNGFYQGVGNTAKIAIYDDFRDSDMKAAEFVKLIDYRKRTLNIKGDEKINKYQLIIITSLQNPKWIYRNYYEEDRIQWLRRMEIEHIPGNGEWGKMARFLLWLDECAE